MTTCPACGHSAAAADVRFCPECGARIAPAEAAPPEAPPQAGGTTISVKQDVGSQTGGSATGVDLGGVSGPVTVNQQGDSFKVSLGNVGAGSQVAVGKNIHQSGAGAPPYSAADRAAVAQGLEGLKAALGEPEVSADRRALGTEFARQLEATLLREDGPPDAAVIQVCGDWLVANIPGALEALVAALSGPAGARALAAAGEAAVRWSETRLRRSG